MTAAWKGHLAVVQKLLQVVGAQGLAEQDDDGWTALHFAADEGHEEAVKFLLSNGAQANSKDNKGVAPLITAATKGHLGVVQRLLQVVGEQGLTDRDVAGLTALHHAAERGHEEVVKFLVSNGAQANSKDNKGVTPLMRASHQGCLGVVQMLLQIVGEQGLGEQDVEGMIMAAIHHAAGGGHTDVMAFLLTRGAQASSKDSGGMTPLMHASCQGQLGAVKLLFGWDRRGQGLAETDDQGRTPLYIAVVAEFWRPVEFLISKGAQAL